MGAAFSKNDSLEGIKWFKEEFDDLEFVYWRSNFGGDFWSFNLRFLAKFYGISDWKELYKNPNNYETILKSFAWANADSVERLTNPEKQQEYNRIKKASEIFDNPKLMVEYLEPNIVIFLHWHKEEDWLIKDMEILEESEPQKHLWYYHFKTPDVHFFWTYHPRGYNSKGLDQDEIIDEIISIYKEKTMLI